MNWSYYIKLFPIGGKKPSGGGNKTDTKYIVNKFLIYVPPESRILDVGCGSCKPLAMIRRKRPESELVGITLQKPETQICRELGFKIVQGDMHDLPFQDSYFDAVFLRSVIIVSIAPPVLLTELNRVLKMGGIVFAVDPNEKKPSQWPAMLEYRHTRMELFQKCGFECVDEFSTAIPKNRNWKYNFYVGEKIVSI